MSKVTAGRAVALAVIERVARGELLDRAFAAEAEALDLRDRAWAQELAYGTMRLRGRLDYYLAAFVRRGLQELEPRVLNVLRLGAYQLLEMSGVPAYAAVSQAVEQVREVGAPRAGGLVNGVLQALRRGWEGVTFPSFETSPVDYLTTWGSHPAWMVARWIERWGPVDTRRLVDANNIRPELFLRPAGLPVPEALEFLAANGVQAEPVHGFPDSIKVIAAGPGDALAAVAAVVQDPAAASVARFAGLAHAPWILDLSAAPGGKTIALASEGARVVAADISVGRMRRVRANIERVGLSDRVSIIVADGRFPPFRSAPAILLDAPCTGTGTLRRHPDGRWRLTEFDLSALVRLQRELLASAAALLEIGGTLVYSTCSLEPDENEMQVDWLLANHPGLRRAAPGPVGDPTMVMGGDLHVLPQTHGMDGAFAARVERFN